jgi:chromosome partitioning protein
MRKICVVNQKGGVGKTTTTINIATGLADRKKRVLILDLDAQGNVGTSLCVHSETNMYHMLVEDAKPEDCIVNVNEYLDVIPSDKSLSHAELTLNGVASRETVLKRAMQDVNNYDYVIIDCPPTINLLNQNALVYSTEAFVPVATEYLALDALKKITATIDEMNKLFKLKLKITAIIPTMYDKRVKSCMETLVEIKKGFNGTVTQPIRVNSKLKDAPKKGQSIYEHAKYSRGAKDYKKLVDFVIAKEYYYD